MCKHVRGGNFTIYLAASQKVISKISLNVINLKVNSLFKLPIKETPYALKVTYQEELLLYSYNKANEMHLLTHSTVQSPS